MQYFFVTLEKAGWVCVPPMVSLWLLTSAAYYNGFPVECFRAVIFLPFLWTCVLTDRKNGVVETKVLLAAAGIRIFLLAMELARDFALWKEVLFPFVCGCGIALLIVLACYLITGGSMGRGCLELFFVMGMYDTADHTLVIFIFSILLSAFLALVLLAMRKADLESDFSITPAIYLSFVMFYLLLFWNKKFCFYL